MLDDARHKALTRRILEIARTGKPEHVCIHASALSNDFQLRSKDVEQELVRMAQFQLIALSAFDGFRDKSYRQYPSPREFFDHQTDSGQVRVRILPEGELLLSRLPKQIGFGASAA
jgi:hypothetical protein